MVETTHLNKYRQKRARSINNKKDSNVKNDNKLSTYFYPKSNLYTRQEFELLDSIYSDEPQVKKNEDEDFWPKAQREYLIASNKAKKDLVGKAGYLLIGVMLTSLVWMVYLQFHDYNIRTKNDTQIVFQNKAEIVTHGNADKQITKELSANPFTSMAKQVKEKTQETNVRETRETKVEKSQIKYHTISNGDSLWLIAKKYYSDPSPINIEKIMKANNMRRVGVLSLGQKIAIP